jgi:hypothetical protein
MSQTITRPQPVDTAPSGEAQRTKAKRKRSSPKPRPAFFIVQIVDEHGEPMAFDKKRVKLVSVERSAERVMELMENGTHPNSFYLRGMVPVAKPGGPAPNAGN